MSKLTLYFICITITLLAVSSNAQADEQTWRLSPDEQWNELGNTKDDQFTLQVAEIKKLVSEGRTNQLNKSLKALQRNFPELSGPDVEAFIEAETALSKKNISTAKRKYQQFIEAYPESFLYPAALERQFQIANALLEGQKRPVLKVFKMKGYETGEELMDDVADRAGLTPLSLEAATQIAYSLEKREKYNDAYFQWSEIASKWPTGEPGKAALLAMGRCKHASYNGPSYDYTALDSAKSYYEQFQARYPEDAAELKINEKINQITEQQAYKQLFIGNYYQQTKNYPCANLYYNMVLENWPDTTAAKFAKKNIELDKVKADEPKTLKQKLSSLGWKTFDGIFDTAASGLRGIQRIFK